ncbi:MAG: hypothetical protein DRP52_03065 [Planctomycetota bacterium]|nr:MAG: hypothetical protein DRP52_03065 [Planctomycetota bacterium]
MKKDPVKDIDQPFKRTYKMTVDPIAKVGIMTIILAISFLVLVLVSVFDSEKKPMIIFSILFLSTSMGTVYAAFKYLQKRVDALEEKLGKQNSPKE